MQATSLPVLLLFLLVPNTSLSACGFLASRRLLGQWHTLSGIQPVTQEAASLQLSQAASDFLGSFPSTLPATLNCGTSSKFLHPVSHTTLSSMRSEFQLWGRRERALSKLCSLLGGSLSLQVVAAPYICYSGIL